MKCGSKNAATTSTIASPAVDAAVTDVVFTVDCTGYVTSATLEVLKAQLDRYGDQLQNDVEFLSDYSSKTRNVDLAGRVVRNDEGVVVFNFGQHRGKSVEEVLTKTPQYYDWIQNRDFAEDTKNVLREIYIKMKQRNNTGTIQFKD